jgi:flagellar export protein FliJ
VPFRFPLASVLRLRESIERRAEVSLKSAQLEVARARRRIDELTDEMAKACQDREKTLRISTTANRLQSMQVEINTTIEAKLILLETLQTLKLQRDTQMKVYKTAHSGRQVLTDLQTQYKDLYEQEELRRQQRQVDDIFAARWLRS